MAQHSHMTNTPAAPAQPAAATSPSILDRAARPAAKPGSSRTAAELRAAGKLHPEAQEEQAIALQQAEAAAQTGAEAPVTLASAEGAVAATAGEAAAGAEAGAAATASAAAGAGASGGAAAAGLSPLAIGGGVLGLAAIGAAAGGGGGGGGSAPAPNANQKPGAGDQPLAQDDPSKPKPDANGKPQEPGQNGEASDSGKADGSGTTPSGDGKTGNDTHSPEQPQKPVPAGPAEAQGTPELPEVATTGETRLSNLKQAFEASAGGAKVDFVKITQISASEDATAPDARIVRTGDDDGQGIDADVQGVNAGTVLARTVLKAEAASGTIDSDQTAPVKYTAYELIDAGKPLTRAEAEQEAKARGGKLLEINDENELHWLMRHMSDKLGATNGNNATTPAWIGSNKVSTPEHNAAKDDAIQRISNNDSSRVQTLDHDGLTLSRYVIEYGDYQPPLTLNGKPVQEGDIIKADDFGKLVWNSTYNSAGMLKFQAVDSANPASAKPLPNAKEHTSTITESENVHPAAPSAQESHQGQPGAVGTQPETQAQQQDAENKKDDKPGQKAQDGKKGEADQQADHQAQNPHKDAHQDQHNQAHQDGEKAKDKTPEEKKPTEKPAGDGQKDEGGHANDHAHSQDERDQAHHNGHAEESDHVPAGSVKEPLPVYQSGNVMKVGFDAPATAIKLEYLNGTDAAHKPAAVKILEPGSLKLDGQPVEENTIITADKFEKLTWDATTSNGGSFSFIPVSGQEGHPHLVGAVKQRIEVDEAAASPAYPETHAQTEDVRSNTDQKLDAALFKGTDPNKAPAYIHITDVKPNGPSAETAGKFHLSVDRAGIARVELGGKDAEHSIVKAEDFGNIHWDTSINQGGSFTFQALDKHRQPIEGSVKQTITVHELPPPAEYGKEAYPQNAAFNADVPIDKNVFQGNNGIHPAHVKITAIQGANGQPTNAPVLKLGDGENSRVLQVGDTLTADETGKVHWDASQTDGGGSFTFQEVTKSGQPVGSDMSRTVQVTEAADPSLPLPPKDTPEAAQPPSPPPAPEHGSSHQADEKGGQEGEEKGSGQQTQEGPQSQPGAPGGTQNNEGGEHENDTQDADHGPAQSQGQDQGQGDDPPVTTPPADRTPGAQTNGLTDAEKQNATQPEGQSGHAQANAGSPDTSPSAESASAGNGNPSSTGQVSGSGDGTPNEDAHHEVSSSQPGMATALTTRSVIVLSELLSAEETFGEADSMMHSSIYSHSSQDLGTLLPVSEVHLQY